MAHTSAPGKGMKQYYGVTFLIGLGFFTMGLMDPLYDSYLPMFLKNFIQSDGLVGSVMGLDNLFAILLIPVFSALSDRVRTPIGRRMPFIIVTLPLTAIFFGLMPGAALKSLAFLIVIVFLLNLFKQAARGPVVALMPDIIPGEYRSEANGVINTMGGIAAIVGTIGLARLYDVNLPILGGTLKDFPGSPGWATTPVGSLPFMIAAVLVVLATLLLFIFVKEKKEATEKSEEREPLLKSIRLVLSEKDKSALFILLALLLWFIGYQGMLPWVGLYSKDFLNLSPGSAALSAGMVGVAYAIFAIPSGIVAHKIGRKKTIRGALWALSAITLLLYVHHPLTGLLGFGHAARYLSFWAILFLYGTFWVTVITNSFPMLWQMATYDNMGIYTGLYYFCSQIAGVLAPALTGALRDLFGERIIFLVGSVCMLSASFVIAKVTKGETTKAET